MDWPVTDGDVAISSASSSWYGAHHQDDQERRHAPVRLGESPIFRDRDCTLHWVDFVSSPCRVFILPLDPATSDVRAPPRVLDVPLEHISVIRFCATRPGTYICAYSRGIAFLDEATGRVDVVRELVTEEEARRGLGLNDGGIDPQGRFWVGGLDLPRLQRMLRREEEEEEEGGWKGQSKLWRFDGTTCEVMAHDVMCGNGMGWSPDGKYMYFNDSGTQACWRYSFDGASGTISNPTNILTDRLGATVLNDGMTVDLFPEGTLLKKIILPAQCVTCPAWVGKRRDSLIITTAQPLIGSAPPGDRGGELFRYDAQVQGIPDYEFVG